MKINDLKLAPKIIILLVIVVFGLMAAYGFFQIRKIEKTLNEDAEKNHVLLLSNSLGVFSKAMWEFDKEIALKGMEPLFEAGTVQSIRIFDTRGTLFNGLEYSNSVDGKILLNSISPINSKYADLNIGKPTEPKKEYHQSASKLVSSMQNFPNQKHRLFASLWWKENPDSAPKFLGNVVMDFSTEYISARINEQKVGFVFLAVGLSVAILVLTFLFLHFQVISPIRKLMQASLDVAHGKYMKLKPLKRHDEIGSLTENFNFMVNKIEHNLNLIRGLSEASQEIVKCQDPKEVAEIYGNYARKLVKAEKVEIWINAQSENSNGDATGLVRLSDNKVIGENDPTLHRMILAKDVIDEEDNPDSDFLHALVVPLLNSSGMLLGMVEIFYNKYKVKYGEEEVRIIKGLGVSLTTAIENYWHVLKEKNRANVERDLELAGAVQDSIISKSFPKSDIYDISTYYKTASQCGGDWFGVYNFAKDKVLVLFGDVTGHGTPAALITAVTRGAADMLKQLIHQNDDQHLTEELPAKALEYINECIFQTGRQSYFMTMVAAFFDFSAEKMYASSAGHTPPAFMFHKEGKTEVKYIYPRSGSRLGFESGVKYETQTFDFKPGQQLLFYTDGIVEGENKAAREYGYKKFKTSMEIHGNKDPDTFLKNVTDDAFRFFEGTPPKDDIAIMLVRFLQQN